MAPIKTLYPLVLAGLAAARRCSNFLIPVDISSRQGVFQKVPVESNVDVGAFAIRFNEYQKNYTATLLQGYQTFQGSFKISAQYCYPDSGSNGVIQLLNHGIGFDKTYWDLDYNNYTYSYVNKALENGYSTLAIDRLGIGNSSHADPFNEVQTQAEVEALNVVTTKLRTGDIDGIDCPYQKVIHVGHSFGSVQSYWLSALYPNNTDGVVLTGYSAASQFFASNEGVYQLAAQYGASQDIVPVLQKALDATGVDLSSQEVWNIVASTEVLDLISGYNKTVPPPLNYQPGYLVSADLTNLQYLFLFPGMYDVALAVMAEQTKQPVTVGELLTISSAPMMSPFTGPVFVITGEYDVPFCGGNCYGTVPNITAPNIPVGVKATYPKASVFEAYIQPNTGHGLTSAYNATAGYQIIQDFLAKNGLNT